MKYPNDKVQVCANKLAIFIFAAFYWFCQVGIRKIIIIVSRIEMGKFSFVSVLLGTVVNFNVDSQNIANFLGTVPVVGRFIQDIELDSIFLNIPFIHNDVTKIKFLLYTEKNPEEGQELNLQDPRTFKKSNFNPNHPVKILIHGYAQSSNSVDFPKSLKNAYITRANTRDENNGTAIQNYNIISVDWSLLSKELIYFSSAVHTEKVGLRLGKFVEYLKNNKYIADYSAVHLIGFSLGGHVAGIAGNYIQTVTNGTGSIGRISGLDPAGPGFISVPLKMRLDTSDADFVDVIHTNMGSLIFAQWGIAQSVGHIDFYPNGGTRQRSCDVSLLREFTIPRRVACNHLKAAEYFKRSIEGEIMRGCQCADWKTYTSGSCKCTKENSALMGEFTNPEARGRFYLNVK